MSGELENCDDKKILRKVQHAPGDGHPDYVFFCPACKCGHAVWVSGPNAHTGATWGFNDNMERPTFTPSLKITSQRWVPPVTPENLDEWKKSPWPQTQQTWICHSVVTDGIINYCSDCTHEMAGKQVPMEPF